MNPEFGVVALLFTFPFAIIAGNLLEYSGGFMYFFSLIFNLVLVWFASAYYLSEKIKYAENQTEENNKRLKLATNISTILITINILIILVAGVSTDYFNNMYYCIRNFLLSM